LIGSVSIGAVITLVGELLLSEEAKTAATKAKHESRLSRGETATAGASNSGQARQQHSRGFEQWAGETATQQGHSRENGAAGSAGERSCWSTD